MTVASLLICLDTVARVTYLTAAPTGQEENMIRATLTTRRVRRMEEGVLHKWLTGRGINTANQIRRTNQMNGITLFKQYQRDTLKGRRSGKSRRKKVEAKR